MKKFLSAIAILLSLNLCSQVTITRVPGGATGIVCADAGVVEITLPTFAFNANTLYLMVIHTFQGNAGTATTQSWSEVTTTGDATRRIQVKRYVPSAGATQDITVNFGLFGAPKGAVFSIYEIKYAPVTNNGADAIVQSVTGSGTASADPTITMSALNNGNSVITFFANNAIPFGGTPESGWTEDYDEGCNEATDNKGIYAMYRINSSDNTPTVTASASNWIGIAIELRGGRRIVNVN